VDRIGYYERQDCLVLDAVTVRNLELLEPLFSGGGDSLTVFRSLDCTVTPMGKRLLRAWLLRPSIERGEIERRLDAVEAMVRRAVKYETIKGWTETGPSFFVILFKASSGSNAMEYRFINSIHCCCC